MKDLFKKLSGLLVCLSLVASLAACGGKDSKGDDKPQPTEITTEAPEKTDAPASNDEDEVKEVVENFMDDFCACNFTDLNKYLLEEDSELANLDVTAALEAELAGSGMEAYADEFKPLLDKYFDIVSSNMNYKIADIEKDGDDYSVTVDFETFDFKTLMDSMSSLDESTGEEIGMELVESGKITENMSEDEMMSVLMDAIVEYMGEVMDEAIDSAEPRSAEITLIVSEKDGEWLIDGEKGDSSELDEIFAF